MLLTVSLAVAAALVYLLVFAYWLPGEASLYGFIATTFLFPNWGTSYFGVGEVPAFFFVELVAGMAVLLAIFRQRSHGPMSAVERRERRIASLFALTVALHYLTYWPLKYFGYYPETEAPEITAVVYLVKVCIQIIFLYGCMRLIRTVAQVERACWLFVGCGAELLLEWISFQVLHTVPLIGQFAFDERGRFKSLTENDPLAVGVYSSAAGLCALYFAVAKRRPALLLAAALLFVPAMGIYQRVFVLFPALAAAFLVWKVTTGRRRALALCACGIALGVLAWAGPELEARVSLLYAGTWRDAGPGSIGLDPFAAEQLASRSGLQARGLDTFMSLFPFGTGEYLPRYYLSSEAIAPIFEPAGSVAAFWYLQAAGGRKLTELHNGYLEHMVSYGLAGVISLVAFLFVILRNYSSPLGKEQRPALYALTYAVLIFFCGMHLFYTYPKIYVIYLLFFHNTFLLLQPGHGRRTVLEGACGQTGCR